LSFSTTVSEREGPMLQERKTSDRIHEWLIGHFPLAIERQIGIEDALLDTGIVDSLGTLDIVMFLEEEFGLTVEDEDLVADHFESIESIASFVDSKIAK
jgi:acyl carrier protein